MRNADDVLQPILLRVLRRNLDRQLIQINRQHIRRAELCRRQRENAASASDVDGAASGRHILFELLHAHERRFVRARSERHAGIEFKDEVALFLLIFLPAGLDDQMLARTEGLVILLPVLRPILFTDALRIELQASDVKAHIHLGDIGELFADQMQRFRRARVALEIGLDQHVVAHMLEHVLVNHIPHAVRFLAGRHVVFILDCRSDCACVHQHFADDVRAHGRGMHHSFQPIHRIPFRGGNVGALPQTPQGNSVPLTFHYAIALR